MKIYFSASSSTVSRNKDSYREIIKIIEKCGGRIVSNWVEDRNKQAAEKLFDQTVGEIRQADALVAEITRPSIGVGQQIALALSWKIPVIALKKKGVKHKPRFTLGTKSPFLEIVEYEMETLEGLLLKSFGEIRRSKFVKFNFIATREINDYLEEKSSHLGVSKSELLREIVEERMKR